LFNKHPSVDEILNIEDKFLHNNHWSEYDELKNSNEYHKIIKESELIDFSDKIRPYKNLAKQIKERYPNNKVLLFLHEFLI